MNITIVIVLILYAVWFGCTVIYQFPNRIGRILGYADRFAVLPAWTFFAPNPSQNDFHLIVRDRDRDGSLSEFREVQSCKVARRWFTVVWYPSRRYVKCLHDLVGELATAAREYEISELVLTTSYLTLANFVSGLPREPSAEVRQFAIVLSHGYQANQSPSLIFASDFHTLPIDR
jgi:hypothetical protein